MNLSEAKTVIADLTAELERVAMAPKGLATVISVDAGETRIILSTSNGSVEVPANPKVKVKIGESVLVSLDSFAILGKAPQNSIGRICTVSEVLGKTRLKIEEGGTEKIIVKDEDLSIEENDRVLLDNFGVSAVELISRPEGIEPEKIDPVTWDDIGGQEAAKLALIEAIELPRRYASFYSHYNRRPAKGILLYGKPGNGKTMLAKATANAIGSKGFFSVKGPEILDPYVGVAERRVRELFDSARRVTEGRGVIFIDEAEAILSKRGSMYAQMEKTIVPMFLSEMDGLESSNALVILATNRPDLLDEAIVRPGRIDKMIEVAPPTRKTVEQIMRSVLRKIPNNLGEPCYAMLAEIIAQRANPLNGAGVVELIEQAKSLAIFRDIREKKASCLMRKDLQGAIANMYS